jgi:hypothetical protein
LTRTRVEISETLASGPSSNFAGRKFCAQGHRDDRRILGAVGHLDRDHLGAVVHRAVVEDILDQAWPRIIGIGGCRGCCARAKRGAQNAGNAEQTEMSSEHGPRPRKDRSNNIHIGHRGGYSHSISENAAVALRAL